MIDRCILDLQVKNNAPALQSRQTMLRIQQGLLNIYIMLISYLLDIDTSKKVGSYEARQPMS